MSVCHHVKLIVNEGWNCKILGSSCEFNKPEHSLVRLLISHGRVRLSSQIPGSTLIWEQTILVNTSSPGQPLQWEQGHLVFSE